MADPEYQPKDLVVCESPPGYDAEPTPGIILGVDDKPAGEHEVRKSDDEITTTAERYGDNVTESDPVYRIRDLYITEDGAVPGETTYLIPEGVITYKKEQ